MIGHRARSDDTILMRTIDTDYLVVGAGAMGMAFTDALIDHADVHVTIVDPRHGPGGHGLDADPFVRLHQASLFYGVASTELGTGELQRHGPERGLQERAGVGEICGYFDRLMQRRFLPSGKVTFLAGHDLAIDGPRHRAVSRVSGESVDVRVRRRLVDASYLAPTIPATTPPPFEVSDDARVEPVHRLAAISETPSEYVVVGSGKTATDAIVWLLGNGVDPDRVIWVRPRDPWMLDRAVVQPDPATFIGMGADVMSAAAASETLEDFFVGMEEAGIMLRVDRGVVPTMAKTPTLGRWELDLLRTVGRVVRLGHVRTCRRGELVCDRGSVRVAADALVVHCAASGLPNPPMLPIWEPDRIRIQTIRAGFPCFCAALTGYVEATRDDDRERNRLCPPNFYSNSLASWAGMQVRGAAATAAFGAEPDIAEWANRCALNPARIPTDRRHDPAVQTALARLAAAAPDGLTRLKTLAG